MMENFVRAGSVLLNLDNVAIIYLPKTPQENFIFNIPGMPAMSSIEGLDGQLMAEAVRKRLGGNHVRVNPQFTE